MPQSDPSDQSDPTLLLTRPRTQSERFGAQLRAVLGAGAAIEISPILDIVPRRTDLDPAAYSGVILTSENGARALADLCDVAGKTAFCVGERTARIAADLGMAALSAGGSARDLIALVRARAAGGRLLYAHGAHTRGDVAAELVASGLNVDSATLYDQVEIPLSERANLLLSGGGTVVLPLFSPRSAQLMGQAAQGAAARLWVVALSPAVAHAWTGPKPQSLTVADHPDASHMTDRIATIWSDLSG